MAVQFSQHHLLKTFLSLLYVLGSFVINQLSLKREFISGLSIVSHRSVCVCVLVLHCFEYCSFVVECEVAECDISGFVLFSQYYFYYLRFFMVPHKF